MQHDFPYQVGYVGELDSFSPAIEADLERLVQQLDPQLVHPISEAIIPHFRGDNRFRQIIAVEELMGRPAVVGTANISFVSHSYDKTGALTETPAMALGSFVVDENVRGKGVAGRIWNAIVEVGRAEGVHVMQFTSKPARSAAHGFYAKMGAEQFAPIHAVKYVARPSAPLEGRALPCDEQLELAKGHVAFIFSEAGTPPVSEADAHATMTECGAARFEQLIPTDDPEQATTVLFSCNF